MLGSMVMSTGGGVVGMVMTTGEKCGNNFGEFRLASILTPPRVPIIKIINIFWKRTEKLYFYHEHI